MFIEAITTTILSIVVIVAFLGNGLVIYVLLVRRKSFLKKPYSIFILQLAVVDCMTAIFLTFSRFLYLPPRPTGSEVAANAFCIAFWAPWIPFTLGFISIYTCLALTIERWLAVVKPHVYRSLKRHHVTWVVVFVWLIGISANSSMLFRLKFDTVTKKCGLVLISGMESTQVLIDFTLQTLFPMCTIVVLYCHVYCSLKKLPRVASNGNTNQLKKVTVVAFAACSALIIGWLPGRITFVLAKYGILSMVGELHTTCVMFSFFNGCVNPFLYGIYSSKFREEYKLVFGKLAICCAQSGSQVSASVD